jgi:hypothetical protein
VTQASIAVVPLSARVRAEHHDIRVVSEIGHPAILCNATYRRPATAFIKPARQVPSSAGSPAHAAGLSGSWNGTSNRTTGAGTRASDSCYACRRPVGVGRSCLLADPAGGLGTTARMAA